MTKDGFAFIFEALMADWINSVLKKKTPSQRGRRAGDAISRDVTCLLIYVIGSMMSIFIRNCLIDIGSKLRLGSHLFDLPFLKNNQDKGVG